MKFNVLTALFSIFMFENFVIAEESRIPQYEKPSSGFLKEMPSVVGVSYFACGEAANSYEAMPSAENCEILKNNGAKFIAKSDINKNGVQETLLVGRFLDSAGGSGTFLEIKEGDKITILCSDEYQQYSFIDDSSENIIWSWCYECGAFREILWRDGKFIDYSSFDDL